MNQNEILFEAEYNNDNQLRVIIEEDTCKTSQWAEELNIDHSTVVQTLDWKIKIDQEVGASPAG